MLQFYWDALGRRMLPHRAAGDDSFASARDNAPGFFNFSFIEVAQYPARIGPGRHYFLRVERTLAAI